MSIRENPNNRHPNIPNRPNIIKFLSDNSRNILNPYLLPLQHSKPEENARFNRPYANTFKRNINGSEEYSSMTFKNIFDKMRKERQESRQKERLAAGLATRNSLDRKSIDLSSNLSIVSNQTVTNKSAITSLLADINRKYLFLQSDSVAPFPLKCNSPNRFVITDATPRLPELPPRPKRRVHIDREIGGLDDLLALMTDYPLSDTVEYNINMAAIHNIRPALTDLKRMIGMKNLKNAIIDQVIYFIQNLHKNDKCAGNDFMHTVIYGPPGTGKTEVAKIMGRIFAGVGVLEKEKFKKVTRVDLVAGYLGQTAIKTNQVVKDCLGGVLFIDEAYALGNDEKRDSFSKECIDTLCEALSNHKDNLMVIIAGYKDDLDKCFFAYNRGLDSRFPWRFETNNYSPDELNLIFQKKVADIGWSLGHAIPRSWFSSKMKHFTFYGRDMETLLSKVKIAHSRRVFCKEVTEKTIITQRDMNRGFEMFLCNSGNNRTKDIDKYIQESLYL